MRMKSTPTEELYLSLQGAFDHFNRELFDGALPHVIFTMQRKQKCMGYLSPERWASVEREIFCPELAINPSYIGNTSLLSTCQTLAHEMVHLWQVTDKSANPSRKGYHNLEWARKMEEIGLMPSDTGRPGGKKTGQNMSDYVIPGGRFIQACRSLIQETHFQIPWFDRWAEPEEAYQIPQEVLDYLETTDEEPIEGDNNQRVMSVLATPLAKLIATSREEVFLPIAAKNQTRTKYRCECANNIWGRPGLKIKCEECNTQFKAIN
jgi:predicted SprT family Zn-dependent metalloprotease